MPAGNLVFSNETGQFTAEILAGADVLVQQRFLASMLLADASILRSLVETVPAVARSARQSFLEAGVTGQAHGWNEEDLRDLLIRSVM